MKTLLLCLALFSSLSLVRAAETGVRIRFGLTDQGNTTWDGTVTVAPGRVDGTARLAALQNLERTCGSLGTRRPRRVSPEPRGEGAAAPS